FPTSVIALANAPFIDLQRRDLVRSGPDEAPASSDTILLAILVLTIILQVFIVLVGLHVGISIQINNRNAQHRRRASMDEHRDIEMGDVLHVGSGGDGDVEMDEAGGTLDIERDVGGVVDDAESHAQTELDKALPMPLLDCNGDGEDSNGVQYLDIHSAKKAKLQEFCRTFGLYITGTKEVLRERLRAHSRQSLPDAWSSLTQPNSQRMHRGPREGRISKARTSNRKKDTVLVRSELLFGTPAVQPEPSARHSAGGNTSLPHQAMHAHARILEWASAIDQKSPYIPKNERDRLREEAISRNTGLTKLAPTLEAELSRLRKDFESIVQSSSRSHSVISAPDSNEGTPLPSPTDHSTGSRSSRSLPLHTIDHCHDSSASRSPSHSTGDDASPMSSSSLQPAEAFTRIIQLGNGISICVTEEDIPDPPLLTFTNSNIDELNGMWDYAPKYWQDRSPLIVKNRRIPIKYWRDLYNARIKLPSGRAWKANQWKGIKTNYGRWRIIVARWRRLSQEEFWRDFSLPDGNRMSFSSMVSHFVELRAREDKELADMARSEYHDQFSTIFSYVKGGQRLVKVKDQDIARQYRKLKQLTSDWDDDESI
ncbi:hypothetical protein CVT24_006498, partial [Panaeolus cyanescens]